MTRHIELPLLLLLLAVLLTTASLAAQPVATPSGTAPLTLDAALALAIEHNAHLAAGAATVEAAGSGVDEAKAAWWPTVELEAGAARTTNPVQVFGSLLNQERFAEPNFDPNFLNQPPATDDLLQRLTVRQPIWTGGRLQAGIRAASYQHDAAAAAQERARHALIYRVTERYTGLRLAEQALELAQESLETARRHEEMVRALFDGGLVVESDPLQAAVEVSRRDAELAAAEADLAVARAALNLELGRDLDTPLELAEPPTLAPLPDPADASQESIGTSSIGTSSTLSGLRNEARQQRPDLRAAEAQVAAARQALHRAERDDWPQLGWSGSYERHAGDLSDSFDDAGTNWSVAVGLRWTAFDGGARAARQRQARAHVDRAEQMLRLQQQRVDLEVEQAFRLLEAAIRRDAQARRAVQLAERNAQIVRDRYQEGLTTIVELLQSETTLRGARLAYLRASRDWQLAEAALTLSRGSGARDESVRSHVARGK